MATSTNRASKKKQESPMEIARSAIETGLSSLPVVLQDPFREKASAIINLGDLPTKRSGRQKAFGSHHHSKIRSEQFQLDCHRIGDDDT